MRHIFSSGKLNKKERKRRNKERNPKKKKIKT